MKSKSKNEVAPALKASEEVRQFLMRIGREGGKARARKHGRETIKAFWQGKTLADLRQSGKSR